MLKPVSVIGLGGSMRATSTSRSALQAALTGSAMAGADTRLLWIRDLALPVYAPDHAIPASVAGFADTVYESDAMIWSTPTYHGSISGSFKNALDWLILLAGRNPPAWPSRPAWPRRQRRSWRPCAPRTGGTSARSGCATTTWARCAA